MKDGQSRKEVHAAGMAHVAALIRASLAGLPPPEVPDWALVFNLAVSHGIAAHLFPYIKRVAPSAGIPPEVVAAWRTRAFRIAMEGAGIAAQRAELLDALHAASIPCVPVKGAWFAAKLYGPDAARTMSDLDIMVRREDMRRTLGVLAADGYSVREVADADNKFFNEVTVTSGKYPRGVELHWTFDQPNDDRMPASPMERLWDGARADSLEGHPCLALAPEDHLVLLANHLLHHYFAMPLRSHLDMALLLRHLAGSGCDMDRLRGTAKEWRMERAVSLAVAVAADMFGAPAKLREIGLVPPDDWAREEREIAIDLSFRVQDERPPSAANSLNEFRRRGLFGRIRYIAGRIAVPSEMIRARYPWADTPAKMLWARCVRVRDLFASHGRDTARILASHDSSSSDFLSATERRSKLFGWALK